MSLKTMKKEDLELLDFTDLAELILKENAKPMNTPAIFRKICDLLNLSDSVYASKIGGFYTSLTLDKRFFLFDNAEWDLRDRHVVEVVVADDDDDGAEEEVEETEETEIAVAAEEDVVSLDSAHDDDLDDGDDLDDLVILDEDELEDSD